MRESGRQEKVKKKDSIKRGEERGPEKWMKKRKEDK